MKSSDFFYELPQELIAQEPLEERSSSRLLVLDRKLAVWSTEYLNRFDGVSARRGLPCFKQYKGYSGQTSWCKG